MSQITPESFSKLIAKCFYLSIIVLTVIAITQILRFEGFIITMCLLNVNSHSLTSKPFSKVKPRGILISLWYTIRKAIKIADCFDFHSFHLWVQILVEIFNKIIDTIASNILSADKP